MIRYQDLRGRLSKHIVNDDQVIDQEGEVEVAVGYVSTKDPGDVHEPHYIFPEVLRDDCRFYSRWSGLIRREQFLDGCVWKRNLIIFHYHNKTKPGS